MTFEKFGNFVVVGLGATGFYTVKFLNELGCAVKVIDNAREPKYYKKLCEEFPGVSFSSDPDEYGSWIEEADTIVASPGVPVLHKPWSQIAHAKIISDIELFVNFARAPIIAVTGTNGKSTVVSLIAHVLSNGGYNVAVGGNLGNPALSLLDDNVDYYVLELSSFQLQSTYSLKAEVAVILNISPDHLDWHGSYDAYRKAKLKILSGAKSCVIPYDFSKGDALGIKYTFSNNMLHNSDFNVENFENKLYLSVCGKKRVCANDFMLQGEHNILNYLAAYAVIKSLKIEDDVFVEHAKSFGGLKHRCQSLGIQAGRAWYNDSKATNSDAMLVAIRSIAKLHKGLVLIAGGVFKEDKVADLPQDIQLRAIVLFGRDGKILYDYWKDLYNCLLVRDLAAATDLAYEQSDEGDAILFSPCCASYDQFMNYEERGDFFVSCVEKKCKN